MKHLRRLIVAVTVVLTGVLSGVVTGASPSAAAPAHDAITDTAFVETLIYGTSMRDFQDAADAGDEWFDWSHDGCSAPLVGNTGRSFNFTAACQRHDFAYRNLRRLEDRYGEDHWNADARKRADEQFLRDMKSHCKGRSIFLKPTCYAWAETFYRAVRIVGGP